MSEPAADDEVSEYNLVDGHAQNSSDKSQQQEINVF